MAARKRTADAALRAVQADERAPARRAKPKTVTEAAKSGTTLELLELMRDRTAQAIDDPNLPSRDLAALLRRLREITNDIAAIRAAAKDDDGAANTDDEAFDSEAL